MRPSSALTTCGMLERRAAAAVYAANAERLRTEAAAAHARRRSDAIRALMAFEPIWTSELCSIVERRSDRTREMLGDLARRRAGAQRKGEAYEAQRRRWARMVRGLERRIAREAELESPWPD